MKAIVALAFAATLVAAPFSFADDAHHPDTPAAKAASNKPAKATTPKTANEQMGKTDAQMKAMHEMHEKMMAAKTPEERNALMAEHMKTMQEGISMMNGMMAGKTSSAQSASPQMMQKQMETMQKQMDMMQMMMQMMMDRMGPTAPAK